LEEFSKKKWEKKEVKEHAREGSDIKVVKYDYKLADAGRQEMQVEADDM
jgi:hypothetical protein